ncbi:alanine racemase [Armatimonas sp.]|uniref:alanine racemase n=1 Tax=Armatimonas sp. TaxID=1872638 RepID=UPI0037502A3A
MQNRVWAEVSLEAIAHNFRLLSARYGDVAAVVKANAYGHGLVPVARACVSAGAKRLCVATLEEGMSLRKAGLSQAIYPLSALLPEEATDCVRADLTPFISSPEFFAAFAAAAKNAPIPARCYLVFDTGMGREGLNASALRPLRASCPAQVEIVGIATHLSSADEAELLPTKAQCAAFAEATVGWPGEVSVTNSPGMLRVEASGFHRAGAILYGIEPYPGALDECPTLAAMVVKARLTLVKALPAGATVGYGRTHTLTRDSVIATVPAGYGDGWLRALGNCGFVSVQGQRCPIVGRVSMDQCQVDITDVAGVSVGDTVTLIGEGITAVEVAQWAKTTAHEPTTLLNSRVPRYYPSSV